MTFMTFQEWWEAEGWTDHDKANPHAAWTYDDLKETAKEAWDTGGMAALESMGLTPLRLRELEAEYQAAHSHSFDHSGRCDCGVYFEGNLLRTGEEPNTT